MATASVTQDIVVWEWQDDNGQWMPYEPEICQKIEKKYLSGSRKKVEFQRKVPRVKNPFTYQIDLSQMVQVNVDTGVGRHVQRTCLPSTSVLAKGWTWEWEKGSKNNSSWCSYSTQLIDFLDSHSKMAKVTFNDPFGRLYVVNFRNETQKNKATGNRRAIRKRMLTTSYPKDKKFPVANGTPVPTSHSPPNAVSPATSSQWSSSHYSTTYQTSFSPPGSSHGATTHPPPSVPAAASISNQATSTPTATLKPKSKKSVVLPPCPQGGIPCTAQASTGAVPASQVLKKFTSKVDVNPKSTDHCTICQSLLTDQSGFGTSQETVELIHCKHVFHLECIEASYSHGIQNGGISCPTCNKMHGTKTGNQPPGTMMYRQMPSSLPGYPRCGSLCIQYHIPPGVQTSEHPHPGKPYHPHGFPRIAYLPDNNEGRRVLLLLIEAWKRRLIFTVDRSSTTGVEDCVTWTGIHHKTEIRSAHGHGYPDDTYLERVLSELETVGVVD